MTTAGVEIQDEVLDLIISGNSHQQVADQLGLTRMQVGQHLRGALAECRSRRGVSADDDTTLELERVDALWRSAYARALHNTADSTELGNDIARDALGSLDALQKQRQMLLARCTPVSTEMVPTEPTDPREMIRGSWLKLAASSGAAVDALRQVAERGNNESARVAAANSILDRVGISNKPEITVRVLDTDDNGVKEQSPAQLVKERLALLAARADEISDEAELVDAELVE